MNIILASLLIAISVAIVAYGFYRLHKEIKE